MSKTKVKHKEELIYFHKNIKKNFIPKELWDHEPDIHKSTPIRFFASKGYK